MLVQLYCRINIRYVQLNCKLKTVVLVKLNSTKGESKVQYNKFILQRVWVHAEHLKYMRN